MSQKRRVLVAFETDDAGQATSVSIDNTATNGDLAREIAATLDEPAVTLEISGGFELREQDGVDLIGEGDIVTARACVVSADVVTPVPKEEPHSSDLQEPSEIDPLDLLEITTDSDTAEEPARFKFQFVTAELARLHARNTPKEQSETSGRFRWSFCERSYLLEAARVLGWAPAESMELDDGACGADHAEESACSCSVAQEIEQLGLSTTRHCRFTNDGSSCGNSECPYSHVKLAGSSSQTCSICADALVSPCPKCLAAAERNCDEPRSALRCPLVQNAGCGHLHHAHCVGPRKSRAPLGCPSGCPTATFPREPTAFDRNDSHLIIAWDGDKIDRIPISFTIDGVTRDSIITMTTDAVISMVEHFLEHHKAARPGLELLIHLRDPVAETVRFSQSTLVSVCSSSSHSRQGYKRFPLFSNIVPRTKVQRWLGPFAVDLHTSQAPIVACGCTPIQQLFPQPEHAVAEHSVLLYVVKRRTEVTATDSTGAPGLAPERAGENKVLALAYAIFRFPPAVRTLAALFLNKVPQPQEKAPLAEALYHALSEFSSRGPNAITSRETRRFETVRILLAYIATAADAVSLALPTRPVDEISLVCALSQKRMKDPVLFNRAVVERTVAYLHQPDGLLFHSSHSTAMPSLDEISNHEIIRPLLARSRGLRSDYTLLLRVGDVGAPPASFMVTLDAAARDFIFALRRANQTDLVTRGPLELKSVDVVPPQIVLDQEGLLAVFTGRGCGTARDVNFFRPTNGGDTEVDVNDVSHALEKVTIARKLEDTWQVDSFGDVSALSRPPDEAIILCLDLSQSMNERSGVNSGVRRDNSDEKEFNVEFESELLVSKITRDMTRSEIMDHARTHLESQHPSCHHPWWTIINSGEEDGDIQMVNLLRHLAKIASREALQRSLRDGDEDEDSDVEDDEDMYDDTPEPPHGHQAVVLQMACFVAAVADEDMNGELSQMLSDIACDADADVMIGEEPYAVPRALVDFKTGELLVDPVRPKNAPRQTFVNSTSKDWFESQPVWPAGHSVAQYDSVPKLKKAVATWVARTDILPKIKSDSKSDTISVTLRHLGNPHTWTLLPQTPTRTLYSLAHRATKAVYGSFTLRMFNSSSIVHPASGLLLSQTSLARGGTIELTQYTRHTRKPFQIDISHLYSATKILIARDSSVLALLSYFDKRISDWSLWHGLQDSGDGLQEGRLAKLNNVMKHFYPDSDDPHKISFKCEKWRWFSGSSQRTREESRYLTRLDLLKQLFEVFLNRAGSFDTAVSLVLGLVTFSDEASVEQELTPVFEKFRERLGTLYASGDTSVYDALDSARQQLVNYRPDLPNLRRRIIIVSDGDDTSSKSSARDVCYSLQKSRVIVDSVQVGSKSDSVLHAISVATGGYRCSPRTSLADALSIFDLETMLYSGDRPFRPAKPLVTTKSQLKGYQNFRANPIDIVTVDQFPPRAEHRKLKQPVKSAVSVGISGGGDERMKRIMREIKAVVADPHPNIDVYVNDRDISFLKIILEAPKDVPNCPYKGGTFLLTCDLPVGYPRDPPEVRFVSFILHPNVSKQGKVCIAELGRLWSSDITLKEIFSMIYDDDGAYALAVAEAVATHASKTRTQWQEDLED
ncbi:hypothetical protein C8R43DRAFT_1135085 [Mycena crocata]|nr:hypothetical protein C8R43DRAFT_1135085 [Mycena crocata]